MEPTTGHPAPVHRTSRLAPVNPAGVSGPVRLILEEETRRFGAPLNTTMVWAHHPALLAAYKTWAQAMNEATLIPPSLKYLVYVRVAALNGCPF
jgi:alkylhydroperoxidase family enzyme